MRIGVGVGVALVFPLAGLLASCRDGNGGNDDPTATWSLAVTYADFPQGTLGEVRPTPDGGAAIAFSWFAAIQVGDLTLTGAHVVKVDREGRVTAVQPDNGVDADVRVAAMSVDDDGGVVVAWVPYQALSGRVTIVAYDRDLEVRWSRGLDGADGLGRTDFFVMDVGAAGQVVAKVPTTFDYLGGEVHYLDPDGSERWAVTYGTYDPGQLRIVASGDVLAASGAARWRYDATAGAIADESGPAGIIRRDGTVIAATQILDDTTDEDAYELTLYEPSGEIRWSRAFEGAIDFWGTGTGPTGDIVALRSTVNARTVVQLDGDTGSITGEVEHAAYFGAIWPSVDGYLAQGEVAQEPTYPGVQSFPVPGEPPP